MEIGLLEILNSISDTKKINIKKLPTQGHFYPKDFNLRIKKATEDDIMEYNFNYIPEDLASIISGYQKITKDNVIMDKYKFEDIKSVDLLFIFFEIVKFTTEREIKVPYFDSILGKTCYVNFNNKNFNYFNYDKLEADYDKLTMQFSKFGYKFSLPSIGLETCLIDYICSIDNNTQYNDYEYNFLFFLGNKKSLTMEEIENMITIFNFDIENSEMVKIKNIVSKLSEAVVYSLRKGVKLINMDSKINFETLFY